MKRKLALIMSMMMLAASLTACGGTKDADAKSEKEPVVEQSVADEKEPAADVETTEIVESTEQVSEEVVADETAEMSEMSYEISEVIYPNGSALESIDFDYFYGMGKYQNPEVIQPYYTITNTSDSAYAIRFENLSRNQEDLYFEAGESIVVPAALYQDENGTAKWCNLTEATDLQYGNGIEIVETDPSQNRVQEMMTITFDSSKVLYENVISVDIELPENVSGDDDMNHLYCYVIYYDEAGNVISCGNSNEGFTDWNVISYADKTFTYPAQYYTTTGEPFTWTTADIYYSYEAAAAN